MADRKNDVKKKKSNVADDNFKKRTTVFFALLLLAFVIITVVVLVLAWYNGNHRIDVFTDDTNRVAAIGKEERLDKSSIEIELNEDNFYNWVVELDSSYQAGAHDWNNKRYDGCTIHLQGVFHTNVYGKRKVYMVNRQYYDDAFTNGETNKNGEALTDRSAYYHEIGLPVVFEGEVPEDGTWVDVVGTVSVDWTNALAGVKDATVTVMETEGNYTVK